MNEKIYTIPVMDGFSNDCECPFCSMKSKLEKDTIDFVLGPSYMEDDVRVETNKHGFCNAHVKKLYEEKNRLGLALMLHTHMMKTREELTKLLNEGTASNKNNLKKFFVKGNQSNDNNRLEKFITSKLDGCYICNRVDSTFERYVDTFFYLLKKEPSMWDKLKESKGFCMEHFYMLYSQASSKLNPQDAEKFITIVVSNQLDNLKRVEDDLEWFTLKFDHRYKNEPWKNSKDAIPRSIQKINGLNMD